MTAIAIVAWLACGAVAGRMHFVRFQAAFPDLAELTRRSDLAYSLVLIPFGAVSLFVTCWMIFVADDPPIPGKEKR